MKKLIQAWKDPVFRATLSASEQAELANPAGMIELTGTDLDQVSGGGNRQPHGSGKSSGSSRSGGSSRSNKSSKSGKSGKSGGSSCSRGSN